MDYLTIQEARELIKKHEGLRLKPYKDTLGFWTVGYGRCLDTKPLTDVERNIVGNPFDGISICEAEYLLDNELNEVIDKLEKQLYFFVSLPDKVKVVLVDMAYNLGISGLLKFRQTLEYISKGNYSLAADEMLKSKWAKQVGYRAVELSNMIRSI